MNIRGSRALVLGAYGLVGRAVCYNLIQEGIGTVLVHSLREAEALAIAKDLKRLASSVDFVPVFGDIVEDRDVDIDSRLGPVTESLLKQSGLYKLVCDSRPNVVIDCINTSTAIAYRNEYELGQRIACDLKNGSVERELIEELLGALSVPRLTRHIQILRRSLVDSRTKCYVKIGTTGTGGMGLNIPYTHSEESPSRQILAKSALAGAQSMLLFLMARTPGMPAIKEIKPGAAVAWKSIAYGPILRRGNPLVRTKARTQVLNGMLNANDDFRGQPEYSTIENVYMDAGENGLFSCEEFTALSSSGQMEFVTPEEIAECVIAEVKGTGSGRDVLEALNQTVLGPSYRAGLLRHQAIKHMKDLEEEHNCRSIAFEMLGPPRVSKLLFEAFLLGEVFGSTKDAVQVQAREMSRALRHFVMEHSAIVDEITSIGIPILISDRELLRSREILHPAGSSHLETSSEMIDDWAHGGWVDLRESNCRVWLDRLRRVENETRLRGDGSSSADVPVAEADAEKEALRPGELVGWILSSEEGGARVR